MCDSHDRDRDRDLDPETRVFLSSLAEALAELNERDATLRASLKGSTVLQREKSAVLPLARSIAYRPLT